MNDLKEKYNQNGIEIRDDWSEKWLSFYRLYLDLEYSLSFPVWFGLFQDSWEISGIDEKTSLFQNMYSGLNNLPWQSLAGEFSLNESSDDHSFTIESLHENANHQVDIHRMKNPERNYVNYPEIKTEKSIFPPDPPLISDMESAHPKIFEPQQENPIPTTQKFQSGSGTNANRVSGSQAEFEEISDYKPVGNFSRLGAWIKSAERSVGTFSSAQISDFHSDEEERINLADITDEVFSKRNFIYSEGITEEHPSENQFRYNRPEPVNPSPDGQLIENDFRQFDDFFDELTIRINREYKRYYGK